MRVNIESGIDKRAIISPNAKIGANVSIGPNTLIGDNVEIGDGCVIGANVVIEKDCKIGNNVQIFTGAVIGTDPQDLKYNNEKTYVKIGDNTIIREYVTINRGTAESYKTVVGQNCLLLAYTHVAHDCQLGDNVIMSNNASLAGHCIVGNNVVLSGFSVYHQFTKIGDYSFVQGAAKVNKDVPPFAMIGAEPLRFAGLNIEKLKRLNFSKEDVSSIKKCYKILYSKGGVSNNLKAAKDEFYDNKFCKLVLDFVENSERGIVLPK